MTVGKLKKIGLDYLEKNKLKKREAEQTIAHFLSHLLAEKSLLDALLHLDKTLPRKRRREFFQYLKKRVQGEPVSYILGETDFREITLKITRDCLVPRPETEILVDYVIEWCQKFDCFLHLADIGTGSGNIAISLAKEISKVQITATDVSEGALELAAYNAHKNNVHSKLIFLKGNLLNPLKNHPPYDAIIANLPYLSHEELEQSEKELFYEPQQALTSGKTGLEFLEELIIKSGDVLKEGGALFLEIGSTQGETVQKLLRENHFRNIQIAQDYSKLDRIAIGIKRLKANG